ncbi:Metallo-dependent phosphatase-like protein [Penicillium alfredii]|uniref:Metallo-dependent phosphatase-like protein n=1 Tax=Penicillium alfredii TaxID=1506179 RepID=A0A9W9KQ58_9EURO|nr:Metallo-dependent phosphatase-like protein [Penicillium alfredii]KAJ5115139.1 Metallo-dependent phosphatase-like protein [Penicillium alfredii]
MAYCGRAPTLEAFEDLLYTYGVDLGLFGHVHNSQRFYPVYKGRGDRKG